MNVIPKEGKKFDEKSVIHNYGNMNGLMAVVKEENIEMIGGCKKLKKA